MPSVCFVSSWSLSLSLGFLAPGALAQDLVQVQGDRLLLDEPLHLGLQPRGQDPHEGLRGEPVLGALLVVALGHVGKHGVGRLVDVVDDLAEVGLEVAGGEGLQVGEGGGGDAEGIDYKSPEKQSFGGIVLQPAWSSMARYESGRVHGALSRHPASVLCLNSSDVHPFCVVLRGATLMWSKVRAHVRTRAIAIYWQECTHKRLCAPDGAGRKLDQLYSQV